ncbi:hypothetical protein C8R44DRAFT_896398 [Mycena epipterygia]|nr:hypothetical protein C8R44DRAFT_896398 [Mycena epipterygia]
MSRHPHTAGPAPGFNASHTMEGSDRFISRPCATLVRNAMILTGARNGTEVIYGDVLLDKGVVATLGYIPAPIVLPDDLEVIDSRGKLVSPGLVDAHGLRWDGNSHKAPILPWLRSTDDISTHDEHIGWRYWAGQQVLLIKLRPTNKRSTSAMIVEPPLMLFLNNIDQRTKWRHIKHACMREPGPANVRSAYAEVCRIHDAPDTFCAHAEASAWDGTTAFPESLYFKTSLKSQLPPFTTQAKPPSSPDILKRARGNIPAITLFASNFLWVSESTALDLSWLDLKENCEMYRGFEFAPRILTASCHINSGPPPPAHVFSLPVGSGNCPPNEDNATSV